MNRTIDKIYTSFTMDTLFSVCFSGDNWICLTIFMTVNSRLVNVVTTNPIQVTVSWWNFHHENSIPVITTKQHDTKIQIDITRLERLNDFIRFKLKQTCKQNVNVKTWFSSNWPRYRELTRMQLIFVLVKMNNAQKWCLQSTYIFSYLYWVRGIQNERWLTYKTTKITRHMIE